MESKKLKATLAAAIIAALTALARAIFGEEVVTPDVVRFIEIIIGTLVAYIVGQGLADVGKEAAKIEKGG